MFCNLLLDKLPKITPNKLHIRTDFRYSIQFELLMQEALLSKEAKIRTALSLYYSEEIGSQQIPIAIQDMLWFYQCGKPNRTQKMRQDTQKKINAVYDFAYDASEIYCAFLQQYQIDLQEIEYLHWWKFKALFEGLTKETKIAEIMEYRSVDLSQIKDKEQKKYYQQMKKIYALPDQRTEQEKEHDFASCFW